MRYFKFQHHDRDDDGDYGITESFQPGFVMGQFKIKFTGNCY